MGGLLLLTPREYGPAENGQGDYQGFYDGVSQILPGFPLLVTQVFGTGQEGEQEQDEQELPDNVIGVGEWHSSISPCVQLQSRFVDLVTNAQSG